MKEFQREIKENYLFKIWKNCLPFHAMPCWSVPIALQYTTMLSAVLKEKELPLLSNIGLPCVILLLKSSLASTNIKLVLCHCVNLAWSCSCGKFSYNYAPGISYPALGILGFDRFLVVAQKCFRPNSAPWNRVEREELKTCNWAVIKSLIFMHSYLTK